MSFRIALLVLTTCAPLLAQPGRAAFRFTFQSTWSAATHPNAFPTNPQFSPFVGGVADPGLTFWAPGMMASSGLRQLAETGSTLPFFQQVNQNFMFAQGLPFANGLGTSPGSISYEFLTTRPMLTLVAKLDPSPDWFVGVSNIILQYSDWVDTIVLPAVVHDAGTDSGSSYASPNIPTNPAQPVAVVTTASGPFAGASAQIGTFTIQRLHSYAYYGCSNEGGAIEVTGSPQVGQTLAFALEDPTGYLPTPALSGLAFSTSPDPNHPCGTMLQGFHFDPWLNGEVLLGSIDALVSGPIYSGVPVSLSMPLPNNVAIAGTDFYVQGFLASTRVGLTRGVAVRVGL